MPFVQFIGVTPQRFDELFARDSDERKDAVGKARFFQPDRAVPRDIEPQPFYQLSEYTEEFGLRTAMSGKVSVGPSEQNKEQADDN